MTTEEIKFIARVIYSEAGPTCDIEDRRLVGRVMLNRIGHPGFKVKSMLEAASYPGAFSCVNDPKNSNWMESEDFSAPPEAKANDKRTKTWLEAWHVAASTTSWEDDFKTLKEPIEKVLVYYHDHTIWTPGSWNNRWWRTIILGSTLNFSYYAAIPRQRTPC